MATVVLRPTSEAASPGNWNNEAGSGFDVAKINDEDNSTYVYNAASNQAFSVHMDDTSGLSGATFNSFVVSAIFQKHGGRGANATFQVNIGDASGISTFGSIADSVFDTANTSPTTINATAINFGGSVSDSDVDDMRLLISTTNGCQARIFELFVTVDFTAAASGYGNKVNSVASGNIGKIDGVSTANIEKVIGV